MKTFDSTGLATSGRIYAGDLNAIQDQYADLVNLAQSLSVGALAIGEAGLQLVRYGVGEARISGSLRTDAIIRALGGLYAGAFTTAQRDAMPTNGAPTGLMILNTTTGRLEINNGTDAARSWGKVGAVVAGEIPASALDATVQVVPVGSVMEWPWAAGNIPSWAALCYGQAVSRTTYAALHALASAAGYPHGVGDGSTTFALPDMRGRASAGKDDMGGTAQNRITAAISGVAGTLLGGTMGTEGVQLVTAQLPAHNHVATNDSQGGHAHTASAATGGGHAHTASASAVGNHAHSAYTDAQGYHGHDASADAQGYHSHGMQYESAEHYHQMVNTLIWNGTYLTFAGGSNYTLPISTVQSPNTLGRTSAHTHGIDAGGTHAHTIYIGGAGSHGHNVTINSDGGAHGHTITVDPTAAHGHTITVDPVAAHTHNITVGNAGSDQQHRNMQPTIIVNKFMRIS